jgi:hypothetical protein
MKPNRFSNNLFVFRQSAKAVIAIPTHLNHGLITTLPAVSAIPAVSTVPASGHLLLPRRGNLRAPTPSHQENVGMIEFLDQ